MPVLLTGEETTAAQIGMIRMLHAQNRRVSRLLAIIAITAVWGSCGWLLALRGWLR